MRYLRDEGVDAYLLLYQNELEHFRPINDTFNIHKWEKYIVQTDLSFGDFPALRRYFSPAKIKKWIDDFDFVIGNGFAPAYMVACKRKLNIFTPVTIGGEYLRNMASLKGFKDRVKHAFLKHFQIKGLKNTDYIFTIDQSQENLFHFKKNKLTTKPIGMPMVYNQEIPSVENINNKLRRVISEMGKAQIVIFSHSRLLWKTLPKLDVDKNYKGKRNDILIKGFANYINHSKQRTARLFLLEYGVDVKATKELISKLKIDEYVTWLPKMSRKEIMILLDYVDIGANEFHGRMWGGTGWEFLSKGVPFFHYLDISKERFETIYNMPIPFMFNSNKSEQISKYILNFEANPKKYEYIRADLKKWFNTNNGVELAKKYSKVIRNFEEKQ